MRERILISSIALCLCCMSHAYGSECIDSDCAITDSNTPGIATDLYADTDSAIELYNQNMQEAAATRDRLDAMLKTMSNTEYSQTQIPDNAQVFVSAWDGCPFETEKECEIWRTKPTVRETVAPRSPIIRYPDLFAFIAEARVNENINASYPVAAPLVERYKLLRRASEACCTDGMAYHLQNAGATPGLIYKFKVDDANFYGLGERCLMMSDDELNTKYPDTSTAKVVTKVRNGCLCRSRQWFTSMLAPFNQVYQNVPEFAGDEFNYVYTDGLNRRVSVSINQDVQNVMHTLSQCP